jgi:dolichol kinase
VGAVKDEDGRQLVHAGVALFVIPLRWLTPPQAVAMATAAVALNWVVLPATGLDRRLRREGAPWIDGIKLYPVAVLAAILLFGKETGAAAWAVLGVGDAASNVIGRRWGHPPFLGRDDRSLVGTLAFVATAFPAALAAHVWVAGGAGSPGVAMPTVALAAAAAAVTGAVVELVTPRRFDDNLPICVAAAAVFAGVVG